MPTKHVKLQTPDGFVTNTTPPYAFAPEGTALHWFTAERIKGELEADGREVTAHMFDDHGELVVPPAPEQLEQPSEERIEQIPKGERELDKTVLEDELVAGEHPEEPEHPEADEAGDEEETETPEGETTAREGETTEAPAAAKAPKKKRKRR